jgi:hypothetical protein
MSIDQPNEAVSVSSYLKALIEYPPVECLGLQVFRLLGFMGSILFSFKNHQIIKRNEISKNIWEIEEYREFLILLITSMQDIDTAIILLNIIYDVLITNSLMNHFLGTIASIQKQFSSLRNPDNANADKFSKKYIEDIRECLKSFE